MLKDKRTGWVSKLVVGSKVKVLFEGLERVGEVAHITPLGVLLVRCSDGLKVKIMPDGTSSVQNLEIKPYGKIEET